MIELFESLRARKRPEDIAQHIIDRYYHCYSDEVQAFIQKAAGHSLQQGRYRYSSMNDNFLQPVGVLSQLQRGAELFPDVIVDAEHAQRRPMEVNGYICATSAVIEKQPGQNHFLQQRLNKQERHQAGLEISKRQYNKRFRYLKRLEQKNQQLVKQLKHYEFMLIGKSGLATQLNFDDFSQDIPTACFIAYYVARCNLRSEFTVNAQQRTYDEIAHHLFLQCRQSPTVNWWAVAHVFPERQVLEHLTDEQKGRLVGKWYRILESIAELLADVWAKSNIQRTTMIVRKGNDSSTWNLTANAWNKARDAWFALNDSLGTQAITESVCFGKVLRLMAADVACWHRETGGELEPDTLVWNRLPLPWQVFRGEAVCTKADVEQVCRECGVDPIKKGWCEPKPSRRAVPYRPTPELVHGVTVSHPGLSRLLKQAGYFS